MSRAWILKHFGPATSTSWTVPSTQGLAYAETGNPRKALAQPRFYVRHAGSAGDHADKAADEDQTRKVLATRFVIAQLVAVRAHRDSHVS